MGVMIALADKREVIQAVISGSAINQDGRSSSLTSPHGPSQQAVMHAAWSSAGLSTASMKMYQGHLTGTSLGEPPPSTAFLLPAGPTFTVPWA